MRPDETVKVPIDQVLEERDDRFYAALDQVDRYGKQFAWLWRQNMCVEAVSIQHAAIVFMDQFGPQMMRQLADTYWIATRSFTLTR